MAGNNLPSFAQAATNLWSCQKENKDLVATWEDEVSTDLILLHPYVLNNPFYNDSAIFDFNNVDTGLSFMMGRPWRQSIYENKGGGSLPYKIMGIAKDAAGLPKAGCRALLYQTDGDLKIAETVTDTNGIYAFELADTVTQYYVKVFQIAPPLAGISVRNLTGA